MGAERDEKGIDLDIKGAIEGHERFRREFEREGVLPKPRHGQAEAASLMDRLLRQPGRSGPDHLGRSRRTL